MGNEAYQKSYDGASTNIQISSLFLTRRLARVVSAQQEKLESGATVRIDSTVSAALMHQPSDSTLLWDAVRVMTRLLRRAGR